jgi:hypothetical protein
VAGFAYNIAIGNGVSTTRADQVSIGSSTNTYTLAGIASDESVAAQSGRTSLVTSDSSGTLATDGGNTFRLIRKNRDDIDDNSEGIAMALSLQDPDLISGERIGLKMGWGTFSGENAMGVTVAGVLVPDLGKGIRLGIAGGAAFGLDHGNAGGRAGVQLSW